MEFSDIDREGKRGGGGEVEDKGGRWFVFLGGVLVDGEFRSISWS